MEISHQIVYGFRVLFFGIVLLFVISLAYAEPVYEAKGDGVRVVVYTEDCALKEVSNLPRRATWTENGKTHEGCAGLHPMGLAMFYFADKTVVAIPMSQFARITGA